MSERTGSREGAGPFFAIADSLEIPDADLESYIGHFGLLGLLRVGVNSCSVNTRNW